MNKNNFFPHLFIISLVQMAMRCLVRVTNIILFAFFYYINVFYVFLFITCSVVFDSYIINFQVPYNIHETKNNTLSK